MEEKEVVLASLKQELERIGTTRQATYDRKRSNAPYSTSIMRRLGLTWREMITELGMQPQRTLLPANELIEALKEEFERIGSFHKSVYIEKRNTDQFSHPGVLTEHLGMNWN